MTRQLDTFESALLAELQQFVGERDRPTTARRPRRLVPVVGVVAVTTCAAMLLPGVGTTAAYSVQEGNAGEIHVQVERLEDAAGLERELQEWGIDADVTYVEDGGQCAPRRYEAVPGSRGMSYVVGAATFEVTLAPGAVRAGETLVIAASLVRLPPDAEPDADGIRDAGGVRVWLQADVTAGPVGPCAPVAVED